MSTGEPLVSIICPTYNHEKFIAQTLDSFLEQKTTFPIEIIVHDDASTDGTAAIVKEYEKRYPHLFANIYQTENQFSKSIDAIIHITYPAARGKYIALCEGDDYWIDPLKLQKQVDFLEAHPDFVIACGRSKHLYNDGKLYEFESGVGKTELDIRDYILKMFFETATIVFRNSTPVDLPPFLNTVFSCDQALVLWFTRNGGRIRYFDEFLTVYRYHPGGMTKQIDQHTNLRRLFDMLDRFDAATAKKYTKLIAVRKRLALLHWYYFLLPYPKRTFFFFKNIKYAILYRKLIPLSFKNFLRYLFPLNSMIQQIKHSRNSAV